MEHKITRITSDEAAQLVREVGDISSDPKYLKREILALKKRVRELETNQPIEYYCVECENIWLSQDPDSACPRCNN